MTEKLCLNYVEQIEKTIYQIFNAVNSPIQEKQFMVIDLGVPHKPNPLPANKMAVYMFIHKGEFLKIGQADVKSVARFRSHHYDTKRASSTLAGSLLNDSDMKDYELNNANVEMWMKENLRRIDIIIDGSLGKKSLALVESALHFVFNPKYEGRRK